MDELNLFAYEHEEAARLYDLDMASQVHEDIPVYLGYASQGEGAVLELGCGTGRVLVPLAAHGLQVVGMDLNMAMLGRCCVNLNSKVNDWQSRVRLVCADMREIPFAGGFSTVVIPLRSLQHLLAPEDRMRVLKAAWRVLRPGGYLVASVFVPHKEILETPVDPKPVPEGVFCDPETNETAKRFSQYIEKDPKRRVIRYRMSYHYKMRKVDVEYSLAYFDVEEMLEQVMCAGFQNVSFRDSGQHDRGEGTDDLLVIARK